SADGDQHLDVKNSVPRGPVTCRLGNVLGTRGAPHVMELKSLRYWILHRGRLLPHGNAPLDRGHRPVRRSPLRRGHSLPQLLLADLWSDGILLSLDSNGDRDLGRDSAQIRQWRQQGRGRILERGRIRAQRCRGGADHRIGHATGAGGNYAKADRWKDIDV